MSKCKSCGADIEWVVADATGKWMPINSAPDENGNIRILRQSKISGNDVTIVEVKHGPDLFDDPSEERYLSHFVTCPEAEGWRAK